MALNYFQPKGRNNEKETLKCLQIRFIPMGKNNQGLTVGELTMAVGALILAGLVWTGIMHNRDANKNSFNPYQKIERIN